MRTIRSGNRRRARKWWFMVDHDTYRYALLSKKEAQARGVWSW
jgi:hypothetical protein